MNNNLLKKIVSVEVISSLLLTSNFCYTSSAVVVNKSLNKKNTVTDNDISIALTTSIPNYLYVLKNMPEYLGVENNNCNSLSLGKHFKIDNIDNSSVKENNSIVYFPVISDTEEVEAIITLTKADGNVFTGIETAIASELSKILLDNPYETFKLYSYEGKEIFAYSDDSKEFHIINTDDFIDNSVFVNSISHDFEKENFVSSNSISDIKISADKIIESYSIDLSKNAKEYYNNDKSIDIENLQITINQINKEQKNKNSPLYASVPV